MIYFKSKLSAIRKEADNLVNEQQSQNRETILFFTPEDASFHLRKLNVHFAALDYKIKSSLLLSADDDKLTKERDYFSQVDQELIKGVEENFSSLLIEEKNSTLINEIPRWVNYLIKGFLQGREYLRKQNGSIWQKTRFDFNWFKNFTHTDWQIAFNQWWFRQHAREMDQDQFFTEAGKLNEKILETDNEKLLELLIIITNDYEFTLAERKIDRHPRGANK